MQSENYYQEKQEKIYFNEQTHGVVDINWKEYHTIEQNNISGNINTLLETFTNATKKIFSSFFSHLMVSIYFIHEGIIFVSFSSLTVYYSYFHYFLAVLKFFRYNRNEEREFLENPNKNSRTYFWDFNPSYFFVIYNSWAVVTNDSMRNIFR